MSYNETENICNHINTKEAKLNDDYLFSASCQEATGLTPTPAKDAYEAANYEELYPYLPPSPAISEDASQSLMAEGIHLNLRKKTEPQKHKSEN